jgi:outer membrane protein assembly factor BamB
MNDGFLMARGSRQVIGNRKDQLMFRRLVPVWVIAGAISAGATARAQMPFPADLLPTRTSLERLGLERQWYAVVPLVESERLIRISMAEGMIFAQTDYAMLHAIDAESGRLLWSAQLGERTGFARGVAANSFGVYLTNANIFFSLDKKTGRVIWRYNLGTIPTSTPACTERVAMVGMTSGMLVGINLKNKDVKGNETSLVTKPLEAFRWHTLGPILTRPLPAELEIAFGSTGGKVYVVMSGERTPLFRFSTGGPVGEGLAGYGTRTLLIPSGDNVLYAVDLFTAQLTWSFPSGAPIEQEPIVADEDIYVVNSAGNLSSLRPNDGVPRWTTSTQGGRLVSVSGSKILLRSYNLDLFLIDRSTGRTVVDPGETHLRAGLNLRDYDLSIVNRVNDRMYFATRSGMVLCLRDAAQPEPRPLRDPKALPLGYIPPEGIKPTPPAPPPAEPKAEEKEKPAEPTAEEKEKPAEPNAEEKEKPAEPKAEEKEKGDKPN